MERAKAFVALIVAFAVRLAGAQSPASFPKIYQEGVGFARAKKWSDARAAFGTCVRLNPVNGNAWEWLARAEMNDSANLEAAAAFEKALKFGSRFPFLNAYDIACCFARSGDRTTALRWLDKSMALGWRDLGAMSKDDDLASLRGDDHFRELAGIIDRDKMSRIEGWRYDLRMLARELLRRHPMPFKYHPEREFKAEVARIEADIPRLSDNQARVRFMHLMTFMGEGHTSMLASIMHGNTEPQLPCKFEELGGRIYLTACDPQYKDLVGGELITLNGHGTGEIRRGLDTIVSCDNDVWPRNMVPKFMRVPAFLNGLGFGPDLEAVVRVRGADGAIKEALIKARPGVNDSDWIAVGQVSGQPTPLYLRHSHEPYWYEYLADSKTVYFQFNGVINNPAKPFDAFYRGMFDFIDRSDVSRLVIDLRANGGGNGDILRAFFVRLLKSPKIDGRGKLYVITSPATYSAAMFGAGLLDTYTQAIFVGDETGSPPNFVGEAVFVTLPYSGLVCSIADIYHQNTYPQDYRSSIQPDIFAPITIDDLRKNRDPAMEAILSGS